MPMTLLGTGRQAEVYAVSERECVKLFYDGCPRSVVKSEAERMRYVARLGVLTPACYGLARIDGRDGIRMERLYGEALLRVALANPAQAMDYGEQMGALQRGYHQIEADGLEDAADCFARQFGYTDLLTDAQRDELKRRLSRMPRGNRLLHMDYHSDNIIVTPDGLRIIDWTSACRGDPLADAARTLMTLEQITYPLNVDERERELIDETREEYRRRYLAGYGADARRIDEWKPFVAAARLFCCPDMERELNLALVRAYLA